MARLFGSGREPISQRPSLSLDRIGPTTLPAPDHIAIWPLERGAVGIDVSYAGSTGISLARRVEAALLDAGVQASVRRDEDRDWWSIRLTVPPLVVGDIVDRFLASSR